MKILISVILGLTFIGCSQYGKIVKDSLYLKFPVKVSFNDRNENWKIDSAYAGYAETFRLEIKNIKRIKIFDLNIEGNFSAVFINDGGEILKEDSNYFFDNFSLKIPENMKDSIFHKIQTQGVVNYIYFCDNQENIIDMENYIWYNFFDSEQINIYDIKTIYSSRLY
jgi:hypothetical protein